MKTTKRYFTVKGSWPFPYDMLRYDQCWPLNTDDAMKLSNLEGDKTDVGVIEINLVTNSLNSPTHKRWESFTWKVL